jgi:hypothetical protein
MRGRGLALLLLSVTVIGCSGMENSVRDLNRSLYRGLGGEARTRPVESTSSSAGTPCFSADTGLLYTSQTGRCAPGYSPIGSEQAERQFQSATSREPMTGRAAPEIRPLPQRTIASVPQQNVPPAVAGSAGPPARVNEARVGEGVYALCYNEASGHVFEAQSCPPGSRWINSEEAELLQRAQLAEATWCFYPDRRVLYRSRACRPGDRTLSLAEANQVWETLPADRRTRTRPSDTAGRPMQPVPEMQSAPRGGVNATPLPAPR